MSPTEAERFTQDLSSTGDAKYATSNSWLEVNYTQLVLNAKDVLTQVKPGAIPLAMVKVCSLLLSALGLHLSHAKSAAIILRQTCLIHFLACGGCCIVHRPKPLCLTRPAAEYAV